jgi:tetratricopeptide (TPR) repeat protein
LQADVQDMQRAAADATVRLVHRSVIDPTDRDLERAGTLLAASGAAALERGALATAVENLQRAVELLSDRNVMGEAETLLIRALELAGRVEDALAAGRRLLARLETTGADVGRLVDVRLVLAQAAVSAARWPVAGMQLDATRRLLAQVPDVALSTRVSVLAAEVALARGEVDRGRDLVETVLRVRPATPDVRCHALQVLGRIERLADLGAARDAFEGALALAEAEDLPIRRLDALHELGTIEMFDHAGTTRLTQARRMAQQLGALNTVAVLDIQLMATLHSRFALAEAEHHARSALALSERLRLNAVRAKALYGLAENRAMRRIPQEMESYLALTASAAPDDRALEAFGWGGCRGMLALLDDDWDAALECFDRAMVILRDVRHPEPLEFRALWPLLLASRGDRRATQALEQARASNITLAFANRGLLGYADAIHPGRAGDSGRASDLARQADAYLARFPPWGRLGGTWPDCWPPQPRWPTVGATRRCGCSRRAQPLPSTGSTGWRHDAIRPRLSPPPSLGSLRVSPPARARSFGWSPRA